MNDKTHIFYAHERTDREVKSFCKLHGIEITNHATGVPLIFIDVKNSERQELEAVLIKCRPGVVVYLFQYSDLGHGAKAAQIRKDIEGKGARVVVPERTPPKRGAPVSHKLTEAQIEKYRPWYSRKGLTRQQVCNMVLRDTTEHGDPVKLSIGQLNRAFRK